MKRVLHIVGGMSSGGAETLIMNLLRRIDRDRIQFDFAVGTSEACFYDDEIHSLGGRIFRLPPPVGSGVLEYLRTLRRTLLEKGPFAAVHSHLYHFTGAVLGAIDRTAAPCLVAHAHSMRDGYGDSAPRRLYRWSMRRLIRTRASALLGCSREVCELMYGGRCWSDPRVMVFPNAIDVDRFQALAEHDPEPGREFGFPAHALLLGHFGSFRPAKNHAQLLRIFSAFARLRPEARLLLVGDGPLRGEVESMARQMGIASLIHFAGRRHDVPRLMSSCDIVLLPSLYEGMPTVVVEAQAAGTACVVSDQITREADLGLGLVRYLSLSEPETGWAEACFALLHLHRPSWAVRLAALRARGYDIRQSVHTLEKLYACGSSDLR